MRGVWGRWNGYRRLAASCALLMGGLATALLVSSPGAPLWGSQCGVSASAVFTAAKVLPKDTRPVEDPQEVSADQASIDAAQQTVDDLAARQTQVDAQQAAAQKLTDQAQTAEDVLSSAVNPADAVSSAQEAVTSAQTAIDSDQSSLSMDQSLFNEVSSYGDSSFEQGLIDTDNKNLASDQQKLADAQSALTAAQAKAATDAATRQQRQAQADSLTAKAADLTSKAAAAASQLADDQQSAQTTLDEAKKTQSSDHTAFESTLSNWTQAHLVKVGRVTAANAVIGDCRSSAKRSVGVAAGLLVLAAGLGAAAFFDGRDLSVAGALGGVRGAASGLRGKLPRRPARGSKTKDRP